jgi:hypothetical protein
LICIKINNERARGEKNGNNDPEPIYNNEKILYALKDLEYERSSSSTFYDKEINHLYEF